jgi:protein-tyrosine phosphatase
VIDIHCHMLPGIDDGPPTLEASLALAQACVDDGITHSVLTPHVFPGRFENRRSNIEDEFNRFAAVLKASGIPLSISWAGEVRLTPEVIDLQKAAELPFLGLADGFHQMLLELPDGQVPLGSERFVQLLLGHRVRPVIAHPERNRAVMEQPGKLAPFIELGCAVQVTAGSLVGQFGAKAQACAEALLDKGWVTVVASDAHNLSGRRPRMREARDWLQLHHGDAAARRLTQLAPARLCGLPAPAAVGAAN